MASFRDAINGAMREAYCQVLEAVDGYYGFFDSLGVPAGQVPPSWRKYWCDDDGPSPPAAPFTGGQCDIVYRLQNGTTNSSGQLNFGNGVARPGPITGARIISSEETNSVPPGRRQYTIEWSGPNMGVLIQEPLSYAPVQFRVVPNDGQPDNCGNPPGPQPTYPPEGIDVPVTIPFDSPEGPVSEPATIRIFAPIVVGYAPFTVNAPVTINGPNIDFSGTLEITPEFNFEPNFGGGDSSPGQPVGTGPNEDPSSAPDTDEDDSENRLIGVLVRSQPTGETRTTELDESNAPDLFVPRLATVYFRTRNRGLLGWNGPHDVKTTSAYIPVPENVHAVDVRVSYQQGWSGGFFKVFDRVAPDTP